jgi:hypothetical protein
MDDNTKVMRSMILALAMAMKISPKQLVSMIIDEEAQAKYASACLIETAEQKLKCAKAMVQKHADARKKRNK